jgi:hypothetical protein
MSIVSRMPRERSSSRGAGSFGIGRVRKIDSVSPPASLNGVEVLVVCRHRGVEDRVQLVAVRAAEVERDEAVDFLVAVDLVSVELGLEVVELVGVGLLAEKRGAIVGLEGRLGDVGVVHEVEHHHVVLARVRPVEP